MGENFRNEVDEILNLYGDHDSLAHFLFAHDLFRKPASSFRDHALSAYFGVTAEIGGANGFVAPQFVGLAAEHDASGFQNVAVIGHRKPHARVLLDKQHRGVAPDFRDDPEHRLHDDRRKAERGLVQQQ